MRCDGVLPKMIPSDFSYGSPAEQRRSVVREGDLEAAFIEKLANLKYTIRPDIRNRDALEKNFREKFDALNRVTLTDGEFSRLQEEIITSDVFTAARTIRGVNSFTRDDGTPLNYTLVNIRDWCKNTYEVVNQLRINTDNSQKQLGNTFWSIASCLTRLDDLIAAQTQKHEALKTHKKGLMQQLFPSPEAE